MQEADVVRRFLFPADQDAAILVEPRVDAFHNPAARTRPAATLLFLFAAGTDVRGIAATAGGPTNSFGRHIPCRHRGAVCAASSVAGDVTGMLSRVASTSF